MFSDCQKKWTMKDLLEYMEGQNKFPEYMNKPIRLLEFDKEPQYLSLVGGTCDAMQMLFKPESHFINDK